MRKIFFTTFLAFFLNCFSQNVFAQGHLVITTETFPDSAYLDSAYAGLSVTIRNTDSVAFTGDLFLNLKSAILGIVDTIALDSSLLFTLNPGDSITDTFGFNFRTGHFDGGDNIVVVWPVSNQSVLIDTFSKHIVFLSTGITTPDDKDSQYHIFFNSVSNILNIKYEHSEKVEQVRITDELGKEIFRFREAVMTINLSSMMNGIYFIEMKEKSGKSIVKKILKL